MNISDYYTKAPLYQPTFFDKREFGIIKNGVFIRHMGFKNINKLRSYLINEEPEHVYFSVAKYEHPDIYDMQVKKKYWIGSDLVFDIDNDHLEIQTIEEARKQALKLKSILIDKFNFKKIMFVFSGGRGFHIHILDECIQDFNNDERKDIADFFITEILPGTLNYSPYFVQIDAPVTCDVSRMIRLPGSLHGKTMKPCFIIR